MPQVEISEIRALRSVKDAVEFARQMGYTAAQERLDLEDLGLGDFTSHALLRTGKNRRQGYGVLIGQMPTLPRSLAGLGKSLRLIHDHPLAIIGIPGPNGRWNRVVVVRPRLVKSGNSLTYRTGRMEIEVDAPSRHDAEVLGQIAWDTSAKDPQTKVDEAFDVEAITRRFFTGLRKHFDDIEEAIALRAKADTGVFAGVNNAGGARRVAIRLISQILFCFFLQRKGLLASDSRYLVSLWTSSRTAKRPFHDALEDLFYETLSKPESTRTPHVGHPNIPFLNGGLFERAYGDVRLGLADSLFDLDDGLLGFLTHWTFTLHEETPDENDVAVDPELLGRVFEHLVSDEEQAKHGVVYTPRPVVQFMCREALIPRFLGQNLGLTEAHIRLLLSDNDALVTIRDELGTEQSAEILLRLDRALGDITVLDPAVGSGAFLLGMLAEIVRLRQMLHVHLHQRVPEPSVMHDWKLHAIENCLFGVDLEPLALELCRLRLWLSLIVEIDANRTIQPLPNLEYRTVAGNSLTDFVGGIEVQNIRRGGVSQQPFDFAELRNISKLRDQFFDTADPTAKAALRKAISEQEADLVERVLTLAAGKKQDAAKKAFLDGLRSGFKSRDRVFPVFMPAFHFPEVYSKGGWDIVIANPPYLGKKEVAKRLDPRVQHDYETHFGDTNDLLVLFGIRMFDFVKEGGIGAMIGNDSYLTSTDAVQLRIDITNKSAVRTLARTNCFEGQAITGAVVVWRQGRTGDRETFRWVEAYKRDLRDFAGASLNVVAHGKHERVGEMEILGARVSVLTALPSRVFFRPSIAALDCIQRYSSLQPEQFRTLEGWDLLAKTPRLKKTVDTLTKTGFYERLKAGQFVPLGICMEGGPGLQTGDDRRYLAAVEGTAEADKCIRDREALVHRIAENDIASDRMARNLRNGMSEDDALLALADDSKLEKTLKFPRLLRVVSRASVFNGPLTDEIAQRGLKGDRRYVFFEKAATERAGAEADESQSARWFRLTPVAIDWSAKSVAALRLRHGQLDASRRPRFQNERYWPKSGVTWNRVARYMKARLVPANAIFGDMAPTVSSTVHWLDEYGLLALLNSDTVEFFLKTFLGSLMHIEVGDLRRLPVPVLSASDARTLSDFGTRAVDFTQARRTSDVAALEHDLNHFVRGLYGIPTEANLWITR